jgi:hypothetical protein
MEGGGLDLTSGTILKFGVAKENHENLASEKPMS